MGTAMGGARQVVRGRLVAAGVAVALGVSPVVVSSPAGAAGSGALLLRVTTTADGVDASPGDGVCEVTVGVGDCSLRAALAEAAMHVGGSVDVTVRPGTYRLTVADGDGDVDLDVVSIGDRTVVHAPQPGAVVDAGGLGGAVEVHGGQVAMLGMAVTGASGGGLVVRDGTLWLGASSLHGNGGAGLQVDAGALATARSVTVSSNGGAGVVGDGGVGLSLATVSGNGAGGVSGGAAGLVKLQGSVVDAQAAGSGCSSVAVVSGGANVDRDGTCLLGGAGDRSLIDPMLAPLGPMPLAAHLPIDGSPLLDAVPVGSPGCPPAGSIDQLGRPRPAGVSCDVGAVEARPALVLVVDTAADGADVSVGDGTCDRGDGTCSLRAAIDEVNAVPGVTEHQIILAADPVLDVAGTGEDANGTGDLDVLVDVTVLGERRTIDGGRIDRVIDHHAGRLELVGVTVTGGDVQDGSGGGGIRTAGDLWALRTNVLGNRSFGPGARGGGIRALPGSTVELVGTSVSWNAALPFAGTSGSGAGIDADGPVTVRSAKVLRNVIHFDGDGGGVAVRGGPLTMSDSVVSNNVAGADGGGVHVDHAATIERSTVADNQAAGDGGGLLGPVHLVGSTVEGNTAERGGGVHGAATIDTSRFTANVADSVGGGAWGSVTVTRSTFDANRAASGGGLFGNAMITSSTLAGNVAADGSAARGFTSIVVRSSTLVGNRGGPSLASGGSATSTGSVIDGAPACAAPVSSGGWNVASDTSCGLGAVGDLSDVDPGVAPVVLALGGPTPTSLVLTTAPVVDAIPVGVTGLCDGTQGADQRGEVRPVGGGCDAGAVEVVDGPSSSPSTFVVDDASDAGDDDQRDGVCDAAGPAGCTLRAAIDQANAWPGPDVVEVLAGTDPVLSLSGALDDANRSGDLDVLDDLVIDGAGSTVDGAGLDRVLHSTDADLTLIDLQLTGGSTITTGWGDGGGLSTVGARLELDRVQVIGNSSRRNGGGVAVDGGAVVIRDSVIADNHAMLRGGGLHLDSVAEATITGSTFSGNRTEFTLNGGCATSYGTCEDGSAIALRASGLAMVNSTVTGNTGVPNEAGDQGGAALSSHGSTLVLRSVTVVDNVAVGPSSLTSFGGSVVDVAGSILGAPAEGCNVAVTSRGGNLGPASCGLAAPADLVGVTPDLAPLADHGGPTPVRLPRVTSAALDALVVGSALTCDGTVPVDQRGVARPQGPACDIGAVERGGP